MKEREGKLVVIEGSDGSGKTTQLDLLKAHLEKEGYRVAGLDFPQYEETFFGKMVGRFLAGEFGSINEVNPYLAGLPYSGDRWQASSRMKELLGEGFILLANRYKPSNDAHQAAKLPPEKREDYFLFSEELEYEVFKIPREDAVVFLRVPAEIGQRKVDEKTKRAYLKGKKRDIHEADINHLREAEKMYLLLAQRNKHWIQIDCCDKKGNLLPPEEIHELIYLALQERGLF
jgi:dTMP kinase